MTKDITMPRLSETMSDGKILSWHKKENDRVKKGEVIAEVETDKANMEIEAVDSGVISEILIPQGQKAKVGEVIAVLNGKKATAQPEKVKPAEIKEEPVKTAEIEPEEVKTPKPEYKTIKEEKTEIKASPIARKLAEKRNIDISKVIGTGPGGRIREKDVLEYVETSKEPEEQPKEETKGANIRPLSRMRQTIASRMSQSKKEVPHFYVTDVINADNLIEYHNNISKKEEEITYNDIFVKATALILKKYPLFNSSFNGDHIELKESINIGIAFATKDGLLVPVVHNCDKKSLKEISASTKTIKDHVKNNKLKPEELIGGTFSVSNMGMFSVKEFAVIINPPEAAGLAVGAIMQTPVVKDNKVVVGNVVNITLSADHRVVDGAEAALFLKDLKEILENPDKIE